MKKELIGEKNIPEAVADKIGEYAKLKGGLELVQKLKADEFLTKNKDALEALEDIEILFKYCSIFNLNNKVYI